MMKKLKWFKKNSFALVFLLASFSPVMPLSYAQTSGPETHGEDHTGQESDNGGILENILGESIIGTLKVLNQTGLAKPLFYLPVRFLTQNTPLLGPPSEKLTDEIYNRAIIMLESEFAGNRITLEELEANLKKKILNHQGKGTPVNHPQFISELESLSQTQFKPFNTTQLLVDGPASFAERHKLIKNAKKSIHFALWNFESDNTGRKMAQALMDAADRGVDVHIVVDGKTSARNDNSATMEKMAKKGIKIGYWHDKTYPANGNHGKIMIVDGQHIIVGGMNVGGCYSHDYLPDEPNYGCWRDTDAKISGMAAIDGAKSFAQMWNHIAENEGQKLTVDDSQDHQQALCELAKTGENVKVAIINHTAGPRPGDLQDANIIGAILKSLYGAQKQIDIENGYYIQMPLVDKALIDAVKRGVKVRLLTNSAESVDEKTVGAGIEDSVKKLADKGVEIYLKKGATIHSKFLVVDDNFTMIGSYNLNPRSEYFDNELVAVVMDKEFAKTTRDAFERDIQEDKATRIKSSSEMEDKSTFTSRFLGKYFKYHL